LLLAHLTLGCTTTLPPTVASRASPARCLGLDCPDAQVSAQVAVVVRETKGLSADGVQVLKATLRRGLAQNTRVMVVDGVAPGRRDVVEILGKVEGPRWINEDRGAAVRSVRQHLGEAMARGVAGHGARLQMTVTLRATQAGITGSLDSSETVDRQLIGPEVDVEPIVADMEQEAVRRSGKRLAEELSRRLAQVPSRPR
jgi:hypothetical protein